MKKLGKKLQLNKTTVSNMNSNGKFVTVNHAACAQTNNQVQGGCNPH